MQRRLRTFTTTAAAVALALGMTLTVSGCFSNPLENLVEDGIGNFIKEATGAEVDFGGSSIPADFPAQVPVVDGTIEFGGSVGVEGSKIWTVRLKVSDANVFEKIQAAFLSAGFEETASSGSQGGMGMYDGHGFGVVVNVDDNRGDIGVTYIVTENDES